MDDYTTLIAGLAGITPEQLGAYLLTLVSIATVAGLLAPPLDAALPGWSASAKVTATLHDDRAVRVLGTVLRVLLAIVALSAWVVPRFSLGLRSAREAKLLESRR